MITRPVSPTSIRTDDVRVTPVSGPVETSFGEILERQVDDHSAAPRNERRSGDDRNRDLAGASLGRALHDPIEAHAIERSEDTPPPAIAGGTSEHVDGAVRDGDATIEESGDESGDDAGDQADARADDGAVGAADRQPACPIPAPVDSRAQSLPAPSGQAPAEAIAVAEVAAVDGTAVPAARFATAAVDPLTTAAAALHPDAADTADLAVPGSDAGATPDTPTITGVTVETVTVPAVAAEPGSSPAPAAPTGAGPGAFRTSPMSRPVDAGAGAPAISEDTAPVATHPPLGGAGWVAAPPTATAQATVPTTVPTTVPIAVPTAVPTTVAAATTVTAGAATAATGDTAPAAEHSKPSADDETTAPTPVATATPAAAATADAADGLTEGGASTPLRTSGIAAQAQRDAQIRRAEQLTRLGIDVTTDGLGAIRIEATNAGGGLQLNLGAERASTRQLLAEQASVLRDELGGNGANVSVDLGRGNGDRQAAGDSGGERRHPPSAIVGAAAQAADVATRRRPAIAHLVDADRGLDLHL